MKIKLFKIIFLFCLITVAVLGIITTSENNSKVYYLLLLTLGYPIWGIADYYHNYRTIPQKIILEYTLFGLIGLALTIFLIYY